MKSKHSRTLSAAAAAVALLATLTSAAEAQQVYRSRPNNEIRFSGGIFSPQGSGDYWNNVKDTFDASNSDFLGGAFGFDYLLGIAPLLDVSMGGRYYYSDHDNAYRNFEDENGRSIIHTTRLSTASFDLGLVLHLAPDGAPIRPYLGGGGTAMTYHLDEEGDFVNFDRHPPRIYRDSFHTSDQAYGWYAVGGLDIPLSRVTAIFVEGRWQDAHANLSGDFSGLGNLDLAGFYATVGVSWRF